MEEESLHRRLGNFFILTGLLLAALFTLAYASGTPQPLLLFGSLGALFLGYRLYRKAAPPSPSGRFSLLRKAREKARQRREQRKQPPPKTGTQR